MIFLDLIRIAFLPLLGRSKIGLGSSETRFFKFLVPKLPQFSLPGRSPNPLSKGSAQQFVKSSKLLPVKHQRALAHSQKYYIFLPKPFQNGVQNGTQNGTLFRTPFFQYPVALGSFSEALPGLF